MELQISYKMFTDTFFSLHVGLYTPTFDVRWNGHSALKKLLQFNDGK